MPLVEAGLANLDEVFLPYAQDQSGETFYELVRKQRFVPLLMGRGATAAGELSQQQEPEIESAS
jgi:hypothetical protein